MLLVLGEGGEGAGGGGGRIQKRFKSVSKRLTYLTDHAVKRFVMSMHELFS